MSKAMDTNTNTSYVNPNTDNNGNSNSNRNSNSINNKEPQKSFEEQANWFSRIFLIYLDKLFKKGAEQQLTLEDLGPTTQLDTAKVVYTKFETLWKDECQLPKEKRSLWKVMWRTITYWKLFLSILLYSVYTAQSFIPPIILNLLVSHFEGDKLNTATLWILVVLIFILPITGAIFYVASNVLLAHLGVRFRNALIVMIYRKALRLAPSARQSASTGQIVNMFANDTTQLQRFLFFLNFVLLALPTIAVALALIYQQVGVATFVGLGLIIILIPVNGVIFGALNMLRTRKVGFTDIRVKLMNEILNGIRVIKFYAWEFAFKDKVEEIRAKELDALRKIAYIVSVGFTIILTAAPLMLPVLIFYTYTALGNQLDAAKAFTTISFFNIMQFPFAFLPLGKY